MQARDAEAVARLHHAAMGESLWAQLGVRFLTQLYRQLIDAEGFIAFVYDDGAIQGFIAGATEPDTLLERTFRRAWFLLGPAAFPRALSPRILPRLLQTAQYSRVSSVPGLPPGPLPESLFCSFAPSLRGTKVAGHINKVLFDDLLSRGYDYCKITTDASNSAAARQLESWGFSRIGTFSFYGKEMVVWLLALSTCPRVAAVGRHPMLERRRPGPAAA